MFGRSIQFLIILMITFISTVVIADELVYRYEGDVLPDDPSAGWEVFAACDGFCTPSSQDGHLVFTFSGGSSIVNYTFKITEHPDEPSLESLWVEWNFRSDQELGPIFTGRDAKLNIQFAHMLDLVNIYGDAVIPNVGSGGVRNLDINEFHTYRFESPDGFNYTFSVDGQIFQIDSDNQPDGFLIDIIQMHGCGCEDFEAVNEWDYVRFGTISDGEAIVSSDPPSGFIDPAIYPGLDRFTVTFDQPGYVYIDDITIEPFSPFNPIVTQTRRFDNGDPETLFVVLDRPLPTDRTIRFVFNTGGTPNTVEYTVLQDGSCCLPDGGCMEITNEQCGNLNGSFRADALCSNELACCLEDDSCFMLVPRCCRELNGNVKGSAGVCDDDPDNDGVDKVCGDECPNDRFKIAPGLCGCGVSDADSDFDTVPNCIDQCPGEDDRIDKNNNDIPDCTEDVVIIPTVSEWGMVILILTLIIAFKISFDYPFKLDTR